MEIICLKGTEKRLYELVAPLVMNAAVIRQNNNFPFKTSNRHIWYLVMDGDVVDSFMPLKPISAGFCIDNYYIRGDDKDVIDQLLQRILTDFEEGAPLSALVKKRHVEDFLRNGFVSWLELKNYNKMDYHWGKK